jgi:membrane protease YdiL (CAAX protease family)
MKNDNRESSVTRGESKPSLTIRVVHFFLLTFAFSWMIWIPVAVWNPSEALMMGLVLIGAFGPSIMGVVSTYRTGGKEAGRELWRRFFQVRRIPLPWWILILIIFPTMAFVGDLIDSALGGNPPQVNTETLTSPAGFLGFLLLMILGGPLAEELGWRGFALDPLQKNRSALAASLILGVIWALWHLPLFFIAGTSQAAIGLGSTVFWLWHVQVVALSVIYTWVYNHTDRSILSAFLLHFMGNSTYSLLSDVGGKLPLQTEVISTLIHLAVATVVVLVYGSGTLTRDRGI